MSVVVERRVECRASREQLWPMITDTERMNRALGMGALNVTKLDGAGAARFLISTVSGGFALTYEERPFEWLENERFAVRRRMKTGVVTQLDHEFRLEALPSGGASVTIRVTAEPRYGLLSPVIRLTVGRFLDRLAAEVKAADGQIKETGKAVFALPSGVLATDALSRFSADLKARVAQAEQPAADQLIELVAHGADIDVDRLRPFELAEQWSLPRQVVLGACLHGVGAGLLELSWDLICPSCRTASERIESLASLGQSGHCQLCDVTYDLDLDRAVEVTFRPSHALRAIDAGPYCIGGPSRTPHVIAQQILGAGESVDLSAPLAPGRYRVFARGGATSSVEVTDGGSDHADLHLAGDRLEPATISVRPGAVLHLDQAGGDERHVKLERMEWASRAATAHHVSLLPEFRRQFASEVLRPGLTLHVARVALLFSDLTNSTALYSEVGDARAFGVVQEHFELLRQIIARHSGAVVKTIGDAVMASFLDDGDAVRAAIEMHRAFPALRTKNPTARNNRLKIGVFAGPCYVVTANGVLDYFGQTVNVAARLQSEAGGGELILQDAEADLAEGSGWLGGARITERFDAVLKGLPAPLRVARVAVDVE